MYKLLKPIALSLVFSLILVLNSLAQTVYKGQFSQLKVFGNIEVELLETLEEERVEVVQAEDEEILVNFEMNQVTVKTKSLFVSKKNKRAVVKVYFRSLSRIVSSGGSEIYSNVDIQNTALRIEVQTGASYESHVSAENLIVDISEGGIMLLKGKVSNLELTATTGSNANFKALSADKATVKANTGAIINIKSPADFNAKAATGGEIYYLGALSDHTFKESLGGKIVPVQ